MLVQLQLHHEHVRGVVRADGRGSQKLPRAPRRARGGSSPISDMANACQVVSGDFVNGVVAWLRPLRREAPLGPAPRSPGILPSGNWEDLREDNLVGGAFLLVPTHGLTGENSNHKLGLIGVGLATVTRWCSTALSNQSCSSLAT